MWKKFNIASSPSSIPVASYTIELSKPGYWTIYNDGSNPATTTKGINDAIIWATQQGYNYIKLPPGTYTIGKGSSPTKNTYNQDVFDFGDTACIIPQSNCTLDFYGCKFQKEANPWISYAAFYLLDKQNVTILGGELIGDRKNHDYNSLYPTWIHEGAVGMLVTGCRNITVENMEIHEFPGYSTCFTGMGSQVANTVDADWESGNIDGSGNTVVDVNYMRMNKFIKLSDIATIYYDLGIKYNTTTNGGYFYLYGNGYGSYGTKYDGSPVTLSRVVLILNCYDDSGNFKGAVSKRPTDEIPLSCLPSGTTKFKISMRYNINDIISGTMNMQIQAGTFTRGAYVRNCHIHDSYALGFALTGVQQMIIENCVIDNIGYSLVPVGRQLYPHPMGIDIEDGTDLNQHIVIRNNIFRNNEGLHISCLHNRNILIENNRFEGGAVQFAGVRGTNLISRNNMYFLGSGSSDFGSGVGSVSFEKDMFIGHMIYIDGECIYEDCVFEDAGFIVANDTNTTFTPTAYTIGTAYVLGDKSIPSTAIAPYTGYYYINTKNGATSWTTGTVYSVNATVMTGAGGNVYQCTVKGSGNSINKPTHTSGDSSYADGYTWTYLAAVAEPVWKTDGTDTTDNMGNIWRANSFPANYDTITFRNCRINVNRKNSSATFLLRRGAIEFYDTKFNLNTSFSRFFDDGLAGWDIIGKSSYKFENCYIIGRAGLTLGFIAPKITVIKTEFHSDPSAWTFGVLAGNDVTIIDCLFDNADMKISPYSTLAKTIGNSLVFKGNKITINRPNRQFGANNEGIYITKFNNIFIENNQFYMQNASILARPLTIYAEKYLKLVNNYFESSYNQNKIELYGASRDANFTQAVPKVTAIFDKNHTSNFGGFTQDATFTSQINKVLGDGLTDIVSASIKTASGNVTMNSGSSTAAVTHGMGAAPTIVTATPQGNIGGVWISGIDQNQFIINASSPASSNTVISWRADL